MVTVMSAVLGVPLVLLAERAAERAFVTWAFDEYSGDVLDSRSAASPVTTGVADDEDARWLVDAVAALDAATGSSLVRELDEQIGRTGHAPILVSTDDGRLLEVSSTTARAVPIDGDRLAVTEWDLFEIEFLVRTTEPNEPVTYELRRYETGSGQPVLIGVETTDLLASAEAARDVLAQVFPPFIALIALATWWVARRALRPVAEMTRRVGEISHRGPLVGERLPVPRVHDELALLAVRMNDLLDRIGAGAIAQRAFTADAGHELRSPLAVLRSEHEQAIGRSPGRSDVLVERSLPEIDRLEHIVEDLLDLARADEGRAPGPVTEIDVDDIVFCEAARRRSSPIDIHQVGAARVFAHAESVRRVVAHLLDNAARHASTTVAVALRQAGPGAPVLLTVDDDGAGISPEQRRRVFERFVRLDDARTRDTGGAGLGLSVVAELVEHLGGAVTVSDSPLGGARFEVSLPGAGPGDTAS
jgi:signal transduction histidine kinase